MPAHKWIIGFLLLAAPAFAISPDDLYGNWRLISLVRELPATGEKENTFGTNPSGYLGYSRDGRMYAIITSNVRPKPKDMATISDQQRAELFKTMVSYAGTFTLKGDTVVHHVDISSNEQWTGTEQIRHLKLEGRRLVISTNVQPGSFDGKMGKTVLVWEKIEGHR